MMMKFVTAVTVLWNISDDLTALNIHLRPGNATFE